MNVSYCRVRNSFSWKSIHEISQISSNINNSNIEGFLELLRPFTFLSNDFGRELVLYSYKSWERAFLGDLLFCSAPDGVLRNQPIIQLLRGSLLASSLIIGNRCDGSKWVQVLLFPLVDSRDEFWPLILGLLNLNLLFKFFQSVKPSLLPKIWEFVPCHLNILNNLIKLNNGLVFSNPDQLVLSKPILL